MLPKQFPAVRGSPATQYTLALGLYTQLSSSVPALDPDVDEKK
jgi:hypothetical protein